MNKTINKQHEIAKGTLLELQIKKSKRLKTPNLYLVSPGVTVHNEMPDDMTLPRVDRLR